MRFLIISCFLLCGCGELPPRADEGGPTADAIDGQTQIFRAVLQFDWEAEPIGVRLSDNAPMEGGGDVDLYEGRVASLSSSASAQFCEKGVFDTLAEVPTDIGTCESSQGGWTSRVYLSANITDAASRGSDAGHAFLIRAGTGALYRALMVDVSHDPQPAPTTARFDYQPARAR